MTFVIAPVELEATDTEVAKLTETPRVAVADEAATMLAASDCVLPADPLTTAELSTAVLSSMGY